MYLNIALSLVMLAMKLVEVGVKRNVLTTSLSDQCTAADVAARGKSKSSASSDEAEVELASTYPDTGTGVVAFDGVNPLHKTSSATLQANDLESTEEVDTLLRLDSRLADIEIAQERDAEQRRDIKIAQERDAQQIRDIKGELMLLKRR
jgi:hypothetical protein